MTASVVASRHCRQRMWKTWIAAAQPLIQRSSGQEPPKLDDLVRLREQAQQLPKLRTDVAGGGA